MLRVLFATVIVAASPVLCGGALATAAQASASVGYSVKPSDVALPKDVPLGAYVRAIQPFENWVLICDENLIKRQKVCNITQTIIDQKGATVLSWSLAATQTGQPMMILRVPVAVGADRPVTIAFAGGISPQIAKTTGCNTTVCVAMLEMSPVLRDQIQRGTTPVISYTNGGQGTVRIDAPLKGLATALAAIN